MFESFTTKILYFASEHGYFANPGSFGIFVESMWKNIIGQDRVKKILRQTFESGKLPNAYLFTGPEGVGKDAVALELAKALNCKNKSEHDFEACDVCDNCKAIGSLSSPLLQFLFAQSKATKASASESEDDDNKEVSDIDLLREQLAFKSQDPYHNIRLPKAINIGMPQIRNLISLLARSSTPGTKRIVIISEADTMRHDAQNALLKTLEEPHENTLMILTSSNASRLFPTILSRCQDIRFDLLSSEDISSVLVSNENLEKEQADFLARLSGGSYSVARGLVNEDVATLRKQVVDLLGFALTRSRKNALEQVDSFLPRRGGTFLEKRQNVEQILQLLELWLRDALAISTGAKDSVFNIDQLERLERFASKFGEPMGLLEAVRAVDAAKRKVALQLQLRPVLLELVIELDRALVKSS